MSRRERNGHMSLWWWTGVGVVVVAAALVASRQWPRPAGRAGGGRLTAVVLDALAEDWAARMDTRPDDIRAAVLGSGAAELRARLLSEVREVEVVFIRPATGRSDAHTVVRCVFGNPESALVTETVTGWDDIPDGVRAEFIRQEIDEVSRHWSVAS
ncbi:hypothetical protein [Streptomyces sp. RTd22]|uniref:hypothetical protein n=1 Tax=Streptomyces sp. RTd22 TaxID=1841249 RepID=UPI000A687495|nr:hypothetical protein [Streptomyces sp. RTd22]